MSLRLKDSCPLYLVINVPGEVALPFSRKWLVLVTASFAFARCFRQQMIEQLNQHMYIIRVVYHNRSIPVTLQSSSFTARLDKAWCRPPSVFAAPYCQLCLKESKLVGVSVTSHTNYSCPMHASEWAPQFTHERFRLNSLYNHWYQHGSTGALDALRSAKLAWIGPIYFARSMRAVLPSDVLDKIISAAAYEPELDSSSPVHLYCTSSSSI